MFKLFKALKILKFIKNSKIKNSKIVLIPICLILFFIVFTSIVNGSTQNITLTQKEGRREKQAGQVKITDQRRISGIQENEFLEAYPHLKQGFQDLSLSLESDKPLFDKENFHCPLSFVEKLKSFFGFKPLPKYRIRKRVEKSANVKTGVKTETDLQKIKIETDYQPSPTGEQAIKQAITLTNNTNQDLKTKLWLEHKINTDKISWKSQEYLLTEKPQRFTNPNRVSFNTENGKSFYDFSDVPDEFNPELWIERKNSATNLILSLNVSLAAGETKTIDPTYGMEITILNVHSHPQAGDNWTVSFETKGTADLTIKPDDQQSIDDLDFVSLSCDGEERTPQILENDVIFYPNWFCNGKGQITHFVNVARQHSLKFQFGDKMAYAYNNPDSVTDYFDTTNPNNNPEYYIASKENLTLSGGQVYLGCIANGSVCTIADDCCSGYCADGVCCNTACTGSTCQRCDSYSNNGAGTCGYVSTAVDPDSECPGAFGTCASTNCSGTGYSCGYLSGQQACATCKYCTGSSYSCTDATTDWESGLYGCTAGVATDPNRCYLGACINCGGWGNAGYCWYNAGNAVSCTTACTSYGGVYKGTCDWVNDPPDCSTCAHWFGALPCNPLTIAPLALYDPGFYANCYYHQDGTNDCESTGQTYYRQCACNQ